MNKRWPLHPKPMYDQLLSDWVRDLAKLYEVSYQNFCKRVLELTSDEAFDLRDTIPERVLIILSNGTGIPIDDLRWRNTSSRYQKWKEGYETKLEKKSLQENLQMKLL
jgi:hypothetical protein